MGHLNPLKKPFKYRCNRVSRLPIIVTLTVLLVSLRFPSEGIRACRPEQIGSSADDCVACRVQQQQQQPARGTSNRRATMTTPPWHLEIYLAALLTQTPGKNCRFAGTNKSARSFASAET